MLLSVGRSRRDAHAAPASESKEGGEQHVAKRTSFGVKSQFAAINAMTAMPNSKTPPTQARAVAASMRRVSGRVARIGVALAGVDEVSARSSDRDLALHALCKRPSPCSLTLWQPVRPSKCSCLKRAEVRRTLA
jgi:hypothetical protein